MKRKIIWRVWRRDVLAGGPWQRYDFQSSRYATFQALSFSKTDLVYIEKSECVYHNKAFLAWMKNQRAGERARERATAGKWQE